MRVAFVGPPGVGKSTQAQRLAGAFPYYNPRISSGELVRAHIEADTEVGRRLKACYDRGERVPDAEMLPLAATESAAATAAASGPTAGSSTTSPRR